MSILNVFIVVAVTLSLSSNLPRSLVRLARVAALSRGGGGGGGGEGGGGGGVGDAANSAASAGAHNGDHLRWWRREPYSEPHCRQ